MLNFNLFENEHTELAIDASDKIRIAKSIVAFSNNQGGTLFFGVNHKSKVVGCFSKQIIEAVENIISSYCTKVSSVESIIHSVNHKVVLEYRVDACDIPARIVNLKKHNGYYIRCKHANIKLGKVVERYFQLLSKTNLKQELPFKNEGLVDLLKKNGPLTLTQLYVKSSITKVELDKTLCFMLLEGKAKFKVVDGITYFY